MPDSSVVSVPTDNPVPPGQSASVTPLPLVNLSLGPILHTLGPIPTLLHNYVLVHIGRDWWLVRTDGTNKHKVADDYPQPQMSPGPGPTAVWAKDGSVVHFVRWDVSNNCLPQIANVNPWTGSSSVLAASLVGDDFHFIWSPTGGKIVFTRSEAHQTCMYNSYGIDDKRDLMIMNSDGSGVHLIKSNVDYTPSAWLPDGSGIVADTDTATVKVDLVTGAETPIIGTPNGRVSPDGLHIAFTTAGTLRVASINGASLVNLGPVTSIWHPFDWSPNSQQLAVIRDVTVGATTHRKPFRVLYPSGTATNLNQDGDSPSWSPDNVHFVCATDTYITIFNVAGNPFSQISGTNGASEAYWQP